MTEAEDAVLAAIVGAPEAWSEAGPVEDQWPGVLGALEMAGLVEFWVRPDYLAVTLTPFAAFVLGVEVRERWVLSCEDTGADQHPPSRHFERVGFETPVWRTCSEPQRPLRLPRRAHEVPLRFPERVVDAASLPDVLMDPMTGEEVRIFGRPVPIDPRLGPKRAG